MENGHLHDDKLFRAVHERLSDHEVPYDGSDWDAMSRSLDNLPKTSRFKWKMSLNTFLIGLGVAGLSVLGYALATHQGNAAPNDVANAPVMQPSVMQNTATPPAPFVNNGPAPSVVPVTELPENTTEQQQQAADLATASTAVETKTAKKKNSAKGDLLFGDQIDRRKGFIYQTQEDKDLLNNFQAPPPPPFYDVDGGKVKQLDIRKDSTGLRGERKEKPFHADSTANSGAPTDGGQRGFDFEGNR
jgi:hypothetical protein